MSDNSLEKFITHIIVDRLLDTNGMTHHIWQVVVTIVYGKTKVFK
jgi:hypothetical protein